MDYQTSFDVIRELRPHVIDATTFAARMRRQIEQGYRPLVGWKDDQSEALAAYRHQEGLRRWRFFNVDDLVTASDAWSHGVGVKLTKTWHEDS
ncbi:hypothetical protein [Burkholderia sp. SCN-KJ]|uniref:hypothetical protein n=1 Tax=Burkholderia sp. SCN-KJ TaxID=2969248 RepID=UPI0021504FA4|nr:hypothetical protein [Burkholderia sp. SCN-KJ]MCR4470032.1 hypothetical protein [Burkholderia sp. SCN-KJ]